MADRLTTYLEAFTSPRRVGPEVPAQDRRPYGRRLGDAFAALLESVDPRRLPLHGGDVTTVVVTVELATLASGMGTALVGDQPITAGQAGRLACTASILPAVLGGESQVLDLGRARRLFSPAQRRALALRDRRCRAEGCDVPSAWCEAHHARAPWAEVAAAISTTACCCAPGTTTGPTTTATTSVVSPAATSGSAGGREMCARRVLHHQVGVDLGAGHGTCRCGRPDLG